MKSGANYKDRNEIVRMAKEGTSAEDISSFLQITLECVESFMPKPEDFGALDDDQKKVIAQMIDEEYGLDEIIDKTGFDKEATATYYGLLTEE